MAIALEAHPHQAVRAPRPLWRHPNVLIIVAVALGAYVGWLNPPLGANLKPLADAFIGFVKLLIAPIVFLVVVTGIAQVGDMRKVEELLKLAPDMYDITVFGAEPHGNYNRILLSPVLATTRCGCS